jgi:hypothetical protein
VAYPFNFHIFPLALPNDPFKFSFHAGTMQFLAKNNFDFNKAFYDSVLFSRRDKLKLYEKEENVSKFRREMRRSRAMESPEIKAFVMMNWGRI